MSHSRTIRIGYDYDGGTYYRARYYDPQIGRFLSEDRLRFEQGPNFYRYVQNNPLLWIDPSGNGDTCYDVTPKGMKQVPCPNECLGNVCDVRPKGPPPPPIPHRPNAFDLLDQIDRCLAKELEEIQEIQIEATNSSLMSLPWVPGKSLGFQALESGLEYAGWEGAGYFVPVVDYGLILFDIGKQWSEYKDFKDKLRQAQQRECSCEKKAVDTFDALTK